MVVIVHVTRWVYDLDAPGMEFPSYLNALGQASVIVFFVLSGYLVGGGVLARGARFDWRTYAAARISRIYAVVVPALIFTAILDGIAFFLDPHSILYGTLWRGFHDPVFSSYGAKNIIASILSLESIAGPPLGSDMPLWSLGYEWLFYWICPLIVMLATPFKRGPWLSLAACLIATGLMVALRQSWTAVYWIIWLAGAAARCWRVPRWAGVIGLIAGTAAFLYSPYLDHRLAAPLEGVGLALFFSVPGALSKGLSRIDSSLAGLSYSLYVTHLPAITFALFLLSRGGVMKLSGFRTLVGGTPFAIAFVALALAVAFAFSSIFEARTDLFKRLLLRSFRLKPAKVYVEVPEV